MSNLLCRRGTKVDANLFMIIHLLYFQALTKPKEPLVLP